ncbi:ectoine synthase [Halalkalibacterium halodurans]|uniref:L-ectoine synthase n=1 Tax=Halalkalibacterium halodurans (strain ATCC BAA-125 / DSM 18197 / FERM 7344 / JCM 9153 / C-125) TaxID=272558 RepID=ECTC_HALH5|nr:ectoine synthase [Halalkalibacterium halodurans]Q9KED5.1 RecName: Full=L-ectoine synthase; AltName: Full=N-acetyldiaminobutyrate dehydratase [Halalkalibacterium halodurans C-125]MDY7221416.1 ectoine synthase [Halalkalibacterium halodurans]MDY7240655.1 ectoine synthase [Halalkalibacterium halodurans]MED4082943.1 ectoine synthase [Halalkalibacterium halodurans]MED4086774.1 ectoine synthase [Halalkalibacterium halodurans]MED4106290.1 ectoine synthase [Halalkalibacterium halodurans]
MKVVKLEDVIGTEQEVKGENWTSRRLLLKKDGMGYSVHDTIIKAGTETHIWYQNHLEAVYCIEGEGEVETVKDGKVWPIKANEIYALDEHDEHLLRAKTDMRMVCVFNPPITGKETHDENGVYPLVDDE